VDYRDLTACEACQQLEARVADRIARVCVIGLGYVGLPLATGLAQAGYRVIGLDLDVRKVQSLSQGQSCAAKQVSDARHKIVRIGEPLRVNAHGRCD